MLNQLLIVVVVIYNKIVATSSLNVGGLIKFKLPYSKKCKTKLTLDLKTEHKSIGLP